jgi:3-phytase
MNYLKTVYHLSIYMSLLACFSKCQHTTGRVESERNKEAREDSTKLATAYLGQSKIAFAVVPAIETDPIRENPDEDAADDPALWRNTTNPDQSLIFGTNKKSGIHVYDLGGKEQKFYPLGMINNIDIRQQVEIGSTNVDIIGGSNRTDNSIIIHGIDSTGSLYDLLETNYAIDTTDIDEVYGFCLYKDQEGNVYAIVNGKNGKINAYMLIEEDTKCTLEHINSWQLQSQPEGMVADDKLSFLYIGEEENGIWKLSLKEHDEPLTILGNSQKAMNPMIEHDIEGLSIYYGDNGAGFLLASIQGNFSYAVFDRITNIYLGSFKIPGTDGMDGVEETDGLDIYSGHFGNLFPNGILVVQDGFNFHDTTLVGQNYKYIPLDDVNELVEQFRKSVP